MLPETYPFYPFSNEDRLIKRAKKGNLINSEARATSSLEKRCLGYSFKLDSASREAVIDVVCDKFKVKSRFPLHIETSMQEIIHAVCHVAQEKFQSKINVLFVGGGVVKPLRFLFLDFFDQCGLNDIITTLFKTKLKVKSKDNDFQFIVNLANKEDYSILVNEGIIAPLSRKIKWELINITQLLEELKFLKRLSKKQVKESYLNHVFSEHVELEGLKTLAMKALGFAKARDDKNNFYFRNIESDTISYDCFIPVRDLPTINSLCIDISKIDSDLYLESLHGKGMLLQSIIDANFAILYGDLNHLVNESDFARTICHLSKRGRLFGAGWLAKTYKVLNDKSLERKCSFSIMLAAQLVSRAENHHRSPVPALIVMTVNASAILMGIDPVLQDEVQKLWQEVSKYIKRYEKSKLQDPLIQEIKILMCDLKCSFKDLHAQLQISSMLMQHAGGGVYKSFPTQSETMLCTQIVLNFSPDCPDEENMDICTLFFPYALLDSIKHMQASSSLQDFASLHQILTSGSCLAVGINKSILRKDKYREDTRRHFLQSRRVSKQLMKIHDPHIWKMGFLLVLSHLAMSDDSFLIKSVLKRLISMLLSQWAGSELKSEVVKLIQEILKNSDIDIRISFFQDQTLNALIGDLLSSDNEHLKRLGWKYFKKVENDRHEVLEKLYLDLVHSYLYSLKSGRNEWAFLKLLLHRMVDSGQLSVNSALKVYITLYNHLNLLPEENDLLEIFLNRIQKISVLDGKISSNVRRILPALMRIVLESKTCEPHLALCLAFEAYRLKILTKESIEIVKIIHSRLIEKVDIHLIYLSEKFDALSDFMVHCSLQSVHALKASISRRMPIGDGIFHLLQLLVKSDAAWDERFFIMEALKNLPEHEIKNVLDFFISGISKRPNNEQALFYLEQFQFSSFLAQPLLTLLCDESTVYADEVFTRCTKMVLQFLKNIQQEILENFLKQLYQRKLWGELGDIYFAKPAVLLNWTTQTLSIFIHSHFVEELKEPAEQLLKTLPMDLDLPPVLKKDLISLIRENQKTTLDRKQFVDTLEWMKKLKGIEEKESFLKLAKEMIPGLLGQWKCKDEGFYELIYQVFAWSNREALFLLKYIQLVIENAPRNHVEKISMRLLNPLAWWPALLKEVITESLKRDLVYALLESSSRAIEPLKLTDRVSGIKEILKIFEQEDISPFFNFQEKTFSCSLRVQFAKLCWLSELPEKKSKALSILADTFLLIGDEFIIEESAVQLSNLFLQTMPKFKSIEDIKLALILIQRVQASGRCHLADAVSTVRFVSNVLKEYENLENKQFFNDSMEFILNCIFQNVKTMLEMDSKEIKLVKWGINRLYDSKVLLGYDLAVLCLQNPHISSYLNESEIKKLERHKDFIKGCCYSVKVIRAWHAFLEYKNAIAAPLARWNYLRTHGLIEQFKMQEGEWKALTRATENLNRGLAQLVIIVAVSCVVLKLY